MQARLHKQPADGFAAAVDEVGVRGRHAARVQHAQELLGHQRHPAQEYRVDWYTD